MTTLSCNYLADKAASQRLANQIMDWWLARGHFIRAWVEPIPDTKMWQIRTSIKQDINSIHPRNTVQ